MLRYCHRCDSSEFSTCLVSFVAIPGSGWQARVAHPSLGHSFHAAALATRLTVNRTLGPIGNRPSRHRYGSIATVSISAYCPSSLVSQALVHASGTNGIAVAMFAANCHLRRGEHDAAVSCRLPTKADYRRRKYGRAFASPGVRDRCRRYGDRHLLRARRREVSAVRPPVVGSAQQALHEAVAATRESLRMAEA